MASNRRVLVIAYHYPPEPTSGALRMARLAKYLPEFGWDPVVLTRDAVPVAGDEKVVRIGRGYTRPPAGVDNGFTVTRSALTSTLKARAREVLFFPDRAAWWIPFALTGGLRAYQRWGFDAIVSSAMPASSLVAGAALASMLRVPWIADYRDLWHGNPYVEEPHWRAKMLLWLERNVLRKAARITTITEELARALFELHQRPVRAIPNAADDEEWSDVPFENPECFRIVHAGSLYDGARNPERVFAQVAALRKAGALHNTSLDFYGPNPGPLLETAQRHGLADWVHYHGIVDRTTAMRAERAAALLLIVQNADSRTASEYGSKIFEYQSAGPRVLAVGPEESVLRTYIDDNGLGWFASSDAEIRASLRAAYKTYLTGTTLRKTNGMAPSARSLAQSFAETLNGVSAAFPRPGAPAASRAAFDNRENLQAGTVRRARSGFSSASRSTRSSLRR